MKGSGTSQRMASELRKSDFRFQPYFITRGCSIFWTDLVFLYQWHAKSATGQTGSCNQKSTHDKLNHRNGYSRLKRGSINIFLFLQLPLHFEWNITESWFKQNINTMHTLIPNVNMVMMTLKRRASESCQRAVLIPSPIGALLIPLYAVSAVRFT